eukprot:1127662-Amphidinium_carterae.1
MLDLTLLILVELILSWPHVFSFALGATMCTTSAPALSASALTCSEWWRARVSNFNPTSHLERNSVESCMLRKVSGFDLCVAACPRAALAPMLPRGESLTAWL